jgi:alcohol dehydrogenase class IV
LKHILEIPRRIITGWDTISSIGDEVSSLGQRVLLIYSVRLSESKLINDIVNQLEKHNITVICATNTSGEPTIEQVEKIICQAETHNVDFIIGVGGGSILDVAKAVAGLKFPGRKAVKDYFYGLPITTIGIPWVAVPTTSGTGAEATPNSVLSDEKRQKQSIRGDMNWLASLVILDPQLTISCSSIVTAYSGMDALTQAIESYTSKGASILTMPYSLKASSLISKSLIVAYEEPSNRNSRTDMAYASLLAGMALANARLGIVHGVAHSIGVHFNVPHGLVCGTLLPWAMDYNKIICADRYDELALEMEVGNNAQDLIEWIRQVNNKLGIPTSIKEFGVKKEDLPKIVEGSMPSGSLKANPRETSQQDLFQFLEAQLIKIEPTY